MADMVEVMEVDANGALCKYAMKPIVIATDIGSEVKGA